MSVLVFSLPALNPSANAHGPGPAGCSSYYEEPEYPAEITSFVVSNGDRSFDILSNPDSVIPVDVNEGYSVEFVLHTYPVGFHRGSDGDLAYETSSDIQGVTWYYDNTVGYGWGRCVEWVEGDEDKMMSFHYPISEYYGDNTEGTHFIEFMASPYESYENNEPLQSVGFHIWIQDESTPSEGQSALAVSTVIVDESESYEPLNGYYVELLKEGSVMDAQFSPTSFSLANGEIYTVKPYDYGQYVFDYWPDTMSTQRERPVSISTDSGVTAVYRNINEPPTSPAEDEENDDTTTAEESLLLVRTINSGSSEIHGYYTTLYDDNGSVLGTGFTPATFDVTSGETYAVEVEDYGSYYFNFWQDNEDTDRDRTITATDGEMTLTAVYSTSPSAAPPADDNNEEQEPHQQTTGEISVTTVDSSGSQIYGYYTTLSQDGNVIQTAFSPAEFTVDSAETYEVAVGDYGQYVFDHWSDGNTGRFHDAVAGDELVGVYRQ